MFITTVSDTGKFNIKMPADLVSGESLFAGVYMDAFSPRPHMTEVAREVSECTNLIHEGSTLMT